MASAGYMVDLCHQEGMWVWEQVTDSPIFTMKVCLLLFIWKWSSFLRLMASSQKVPWEEKWRPYGVYFYFSSSSWSLQQYQRPGALIISSKEAETIFLTLPPSSSRAARGREGGGAGQHCWINFNLHTHNWFNPTGWALILNCFWSLGPKERGREDLSALWAGVHWECRILELPSQPCLQRCSTCKRGRNRCRGGVDFQAPCSSQLL